MINWIIGWKLARLTYDNYIRLHQKPTVVQLQEKQHVHEKEMQRQKLQQEKKLQQDVDVVHQQKDLQDEELLADELQQEELLGDLPHEEGDVNLLSFFYSNLAKSFHIMCCCSLNTTYMIYLIITNNM